MVAKAGPASATGFPTPTSEIWFSIPPGGCCAPVPAIEGSGKSTYEPGLASSLVTGHLGSADRGRPAVVLPAGRELHPRRRRPRHPPRAGPDDPPLHRPAERPHHRSELRRSSGALLPSPRRRLPDPALVRLRLGLRLRLGRAGRQAGAGGRAP